MINDLRQPIGLLIGMIRFGKVFIKPLPHDLTTLCNEVIHNDYHRWTRMYDNLKHEISSLKHRINTTPGLEVVKAGYLDCLIEAKQELEFWYDLSLYFYGKDNSHGNIKRILSECREIIKHDPKHVVTRKTVSNNIKRSKKAIRPIRRKNNRCDS